MSNGNYDPNLTSLLRGSGERFGSWSRYGGSTPMHYRRKDTDSNLSSLYWRVTDVSDETEMKVKVAAGVVYVTNVGYADHAGRNFNMIPFRAITIPEQIFPGPAAGAPPATPDYPAVEHGDKLWLRINWSPPIDWVPPAVEPRDGKRLEIIDTAGVAIDKMFSDLYADVTNLTEVGGGSHAHSFDLLGIPTIVKAGGANELSVELKSSPVDYLSHQWLLEADEQTDDREKTFIKVAEFDVDIDTDTVTIRQKMIGMPLFLKSYVDYFGSGTGD